MAPRTKSTRGLTHTAVELERRLHRINAKIRTFCKLRDEDQSRLIRIRREIDNRNSATRAGYDDEYCKR